MKGFLIPVAVAALLLGAPAATADDHHDNNGHMDNGHMDAGPRDKGHDNRMNGSMQNMSGPMKGGTMSGPPHGDNNVHGNAMMGEMHRGPRVHRNFDVRTYQRNFTAPRRFHADRYVAPRGYVYRRWVFGQRLPPIYFARNYWLLDFGAFGLMVPPPGCVWVRYGPDALLIDQYSGEIIRVAYGVFY